MKLITFLNITNLSFSFVFFFHSYSDVIFLFLSFLFLSILFLSKHFVIQDHVLNIKDLGTPSYTKMVGILLHDRLDLTT